MIEVAVTDPTPEHAKIPAEACRNCGTPLGGNYCSECGQPARLKGLSFWFLLRELIEDIWDIDSKAWRSLVPLMFRPGRLTNEYLAGRRARYVAPLRLYLTASVLFFVVATLTDNSIRVSWGDADAERMRIEVSGRTEDTNVIIDQEGGCESILEDTEGEWAQRWRDRAVTACQKVTADSGQTLERAAVDNIPIMMVIFIPVLALIMKLLYPLSKRFYVEHLIFYLHYHAFGFFVLTLLILTYESGNVIGWSDTVWRWISVIVSSYMAIYLFVAMRLVYAQGWLATSAKYFLLFMAYIIGLSLSLTGVVLYTAMTL